MISAKEQVFAYLRSATLHSELAPGAHKSDL